MHEGEDVDRVLVVIDGIDDALTLHDEFSNVRFVGFGYFPANTGMLSELDDGIEDAINEALGIDR